MRRFTSKVILTLALLGGGYSAYAAVAQDLPGPWAIMIFKSNGETIHCFNAWINPNLSLNQGGNRGVCLVRAANGTRIADIAIAGNFSIARAGDVGISITDNNGIVCSYQAHLNPDGNTIHGLGYDRDSGGNMIATSKIVIIRRPYPLPAS